MKYIYFTLFFLGIIIVLANSSQHPTNPNGGFTSAPLDGTCNECHRNPNNNLSGSFSIEGIPEITFTEESYEIKVVIDNPEFDAARAGFQLVGLESDLSNAGTWSTEDPEVIIKTARQRNYAGHAPARTFNDEGIAEWIVKWTPGTNDNGMNTIYGSGMIGSGTSGNSNDRAIYRQWNTTTYLPQDTLIAEIFMDRPISNCRSTSDGKISVDIQGGVPPFNYIWTTSDTTSFLDSISNGFYSVTIVDSVENITFADFLLEDNGVISIDTLITSGLTSQGVDDGSIKIEYSGGVDPVSVEWLNVETGNSIGAGDSIGNLAQGQYYALLTDKVGCTIISDTIMIQFNSSTEDNLLLDFNVYPNPAVDQIYIDYQESVKLKIEIYNLKGERVFLEFTNDSSTYLNFNLNPGMYFIKLSEQQPNTSSFQVQKLIITN